MKKLKVLSLSFIVLGLLSFSLNPSAKSSRNYKKFVERVLSLSDTYVEFDVSADYNVPNCRTTCVSSGVILKYNPNFMDRAQNHSFGFSETYVHNNESNSSENDWVTLGVLAHEAGHIARNHCSRFSASNKQAETEADIFMGKALHMLGASLKQAQSCLYLPDVKEEGDFIYPSRKQRLENVKKGWLQFEITDDKGEQELALARQLYLKGGKKNFKKAFQLFNKNKNKEFFTSTDNYMFGMMYVYGLGTKRKVKLGVIYLYLAHYSGNKKATEELQYLIN